MKYEVIVSTAAEKFLMHLPSRDYLAVRRAIGSLADEPWGAYSKKVVGSDLWRLRVRQFRVIYSVDDKRRLVIIERVARRTERTYKGL